jgi:hypothetical protein
MEITLHQASEQVIDYLLGRFKYLITDPPLIKHAWVYPWGWLISYDSKAFLEGKDESAYYVGNLPIFFSKIDGTMDFLSSSFQTMEESIEEYRIKKGYPSLPDNSKPESIVIFSKK